MISSKIAEIRDRLKGSKGFFTITFFIMVFFYLLWLNGAAVQVDPDSFYHAKLTDFIRNGVVLKNFPWFSATILGNIWVDHHFLYHLLVLPFVAATNPLTGLRLSAVFFAFIFIFVYYLVLKKTKIKFAEAYVLTLILTTSFLFRLNLAKAPALSLTLLFVGFYLLFEADTKKGYFSLFFCAFFYVWLYGGWPMMLFIALVYWSIASLENYFKKIKERNRINLVALFRKISNRRGKVWLFFNAITHHQAFNKLAVVLSGLTAGLIINPYFPRNLKFYWWQTVLIPFKNYKNVIGVGGEWYGFNIFDLIGSSVIVFIILAVAISVFFAYLKKQDAMSWCLLLLTIIFFGMTLKSRRHVEYFVPVALFFSAQSLNKLFQEHSLKIIWQKITHYLPAKLAAGLIIYIFLGLVLVSYDDGRILKKNLSNGYRFTAYQNVSNWLKNNSPAGSRVFHSDWDETPVLFYHNSHNYYLVGLDPVFMYDYNQELYWLWHDITLAKKKDDLNNIIKNKFLAQYVFIDSAHQEMNASFRDNPEFTLIYQDSEAWVYQVN